MTYVNSVIGFKSNLLLKQQEQNKLDIIYIFVNKLSKILSNRSCFK